MVTDDKAVAINALIDAIEAIEIELGITPSGSYADVRARLDIIETRINNPLAPSPSVTSPFFIGNSSVTISAGAGFPISIPYPGSLYLRTDGYAIQGLYSYRDNIVGWSQIDTTPFIASGDLSGTNQLQKVIRIQNIPIKNEVPIDGYVLTYSSAASRWEAHQIVTSGTGTPVGPAGGDLSLSYPNPTVAKINGTTITTPGGSLTTGNVLQVSGSSAVSYGAINLAGGSNYVSGTLPTSNQAAQTMGGDVTGTTSSATVINIHGASVPVAGSLTTGNVLQVTGSSTLSYGAINLAGGSNYVTGILPIGNQANQIMNGDVTGTTTASKVVKLQGFPINSVTPADGYVLTWDQADGYWLPKLKQSALVISNNHTIIYTDGDIYVDLSSSSLTITLPNSPFLGEKHNFKDYNGDAATNNLIINGNGKNIEGFTGGTASTLVLNQNGDSVELGYNGIFWNIL